MPRRPQSLREHFWQASLVMLALANLSVMFSIATSQILLGMSLVTFLLSRRKAEAPPFWLPLTLYIGWTLVSLFLSPSVARGLPQVKKFYIFTILFLGYTLWRRAAHSEWVAKTLYVLASMAALVSMVEFARTYARLRAEGHDFYTAYSLSRVTGFMGHWMTFSGQEMLVLMLLITWLLSLKQAPLWTLAWGWAAVALIVVGLLLAFTRGVWLGCLAGVVYLLWQNQRRWIIALPVIGLLLYLAAPDFMRMRARSIFNHDNDNSIQARLLMMETGLAMVKDHPILGVGPDGVKYEFNRYRPDAYLPPAWYGHLHNNYLQIAAERGLPALAAFLWLMAAALADQIRLARQSASRAGDVCWTYLPRGAAAATIAYLVAGFFEYNFGDSEVVMLWLFLLVHGYVMRHPQSAGQPEPEQEREAVAAG